MNLNKLSNNMDKRILKSLIRILIQQVKEVLDLKKKLHNDLM
jgi:hypothetical protein